MTAKQLLLQQAVGHTHHLDCFPPPSKQGLVVQMWPATQGNPSVQAPLATRWR